ANLAFPAGTCFTLNEAGVVTARRQREAAGASRAAEANGAWSPLPGTLAGGNPQWNALLHILKVRGPIVQPVRRPGPRPGTVPAAGPVSGDSAGSVRGGRLAAAHRRPPAPPV